ncbi:hypothetical protein HanIR_Chr02g0074021 [Helianthus annuus]|nr:hypothetical protein HanIR_Chr02g0074021 [Helianthus annuus]
MEAGNGGFIQEALRGFLKCLGLEGSGEKTVAGSEEVVNNPPPPSPPIDSAATTTYEPLPAVEDTPTNDPLVDDLPSSVESTTMTRRNIDTNIGAESNTLVTIDEILNMTGGTIAQAHYVEVLDDGQPKISLLTTSLISSGGGGKTH